MKLNLKTFLHPYILFGCFITSIYPQICLGQVELFSHLFGGYSYHSAAAMKLNVNDNFYEIRDVRFSSQSLKFPLYYGISIGSSVSKKLPFHLSLEFIHDKVYVREQNPVQIRKSTNPDLPAGSKQQFKYILNEFSMSHGFNYLLFKLAYPLKSVHIWQKKFTIYLGLAAGGILPHVESKHERQQREKYEFHIPSGMLELLSEYSFYKNWFLLIALKYTIARVKDAGIIGGKLSTHIKSWHFVLGMGFRLSFT
jgi:hypothetical protein